MMRTGLEPRIPGSQGKRPSHWAALPRTPYSKMATILIFFCFLANCNILLSPCKLPLLASLSNIKFNIEYLTLNEAKRTKKNTKMAAILNKGCIIIGTIVMISEITIRSEMPEHWHIRYHRS